MSDQNPKVVVTCKDCEAVIAEDPRTPAEQQQPCPACGSKNPPLIKMHAVAVGVGVAGMRLKARDGVKGEKRPFLEAKMGADRSRDTGEWNQLERVVDRRENRYRERIVDPRTGKVIREVNEPLTKHRGHGSAKKPKKRNA